MVAKPDFEADCTLVGSLLDVAPGEDFKLLRVQSNGERKAWPFRMQLLRIDEQHQVLVSAQKYAREMGEAPKEYGDIYREASAVALLTRAMRSTKKRERQDGTEFYPQYFLDEAQLRQSLTVSEMAQALNIYEIVNSRYSAIENYSEAEFEQWVVRLGEPLRGPFWLPLLPPEQLGDLILRLSRELLQAWETAGRQVLSSPDSLTSDPLSSETLTGSFTELPAASPMTSPGVSLPTDKLLTKAEAAEHAQRIYKRDKK